MNLFTHAFVTVSALSLKNDFVSLLSVPPFYAKLMKFFIGNIFLVQIKERKKNGKIIFFFKVLFHRSLMSHFESFIENNELSKICGYKLTDAGL